MKETADSESRHNRWYRVLGVRSVANRRTRRAVTIDITADSMSNHDQRIRCPVSIDVTADSVFGFNRRIGGFDVRSQSTLRRIHESVRFEETADTAFAQVLVLLSSRLTIFEGDLCFFI